MDNFYNNALKTVLAGKNLQKLAIFTALALCIAAVPLVTMLTLQPAMTQTLTAEPLCPIKEHIHSDECFNVVLECKQSESEEVFVHTHNETCYMSVHIQICEADTAHSHAEECYSSEVDCGLAANDTIHTHTENCYSSETACALDENDTIHTHTENCYSSEVVCALTENNSDHSHTEACYQEDLVPVCEPAEVFPHAHTEGCYQSALICESVGHEHTETCQNTTEDNSDDPLSNTPDQNPSEQGMADQNKPVDNGTGEGTPNHGEPNQGTPEPDSSEQNEPVGDDTGECTPEQDSSEQNEPGHGNAGDDTPSENEPGENKPGENNSDQNTPEQNMPDPDTSEQNVPELLIPDMATPLASYLFTTPMDLQMATEITTVRINGEKTILGNSAPGGKEFKFILTEVDEHGTPVEPLFTMEESITGDGGFWFDVPIYVTGTHYYKIVEEAGIRDGWNYDSIVYIVEVHVADDADNTVTTSLDTTGDPYLDPTIGSPITIDNGANPSPAFIDPGTQYSFTGSTYRDFTLANGNQDFFGMCADEKIAGPTIRGQRYQQAPNGNRNETPQALAAALSVSPTGGYQNGTGLTQAEYASLFGISPVPSYETRRVDMQLVIWGYVNQGALTTTQQNISNLINQMVTASKNTPAGQSITTLSLAYNKDTGRLTFAHEGFQPVQYDTRLTWSGDTGSLVVTVNGKSAASGVKVGKSDTIIIRYTGSGSVEFTLADQQLYLKAGSVKGSVLNNVTNRSVQPCLMGSADFVRTQNSLNLTWSVDPAEPECVKFVNEFIPLPTVTAIITGTKAISGVETTGETFTFRLTQVTDLTANEVFLPTLTQESATVGAGRFSFTIPDLLAGTYFFHVAEDVSTPAERWQYDLREYVVTVVVAAAGPDSAAGTGNPGDTGGSGALEVTVLYPDEAEELRFINKYNWGNILPDTGSIGTTPFHATGLLLSTQLFVFLFGTFIYKCKTHNRQQKFKKGEL